MIEWIDAIQSKLPFSGPPERRSDSQIDSDLDDEFAFHLEMKTRELMNDGYESEAAGGLARASFGNIEQIKTRCKRIALEERIMLQRVNFVMMIVVVLMVVGVGVQVMITQRYNTLALMDITAQIAKMRLDAAAEAKDRGWAAPQGNVFLEGAVSRPGVYQIPAGTPLTVRRLIAVAGDLTTENVRVTVIQIGLNGTRFEKFAADPFTNDINVDYILSPNDHVRVEERPEGDSLRSPGS